MVAPQWVTDSSAPAPWRTAFRYRTCARSDSPLERVKKLTELTCTRTVLPSLCTLRGEAGVVGGHSASPPRFCCAGGRAPHSSLEKDKKNCREAKSFIAGQKKKKNWC